MSYKIITSATVPIAMPVLRAQLKLDDPDLPNDEDVLIEGYAAQACDYAQHYTGRAIGVQVLEKAMDMFPAGGGLLLPLAPARSITSVEYVGAQGALLTLASDRYVLDDYSDSHWLLPAANTDWPATLVVANAVRVRYTAGYNSDDLPPAVRGALLLLVTHYYENRGAAARLKLESIPLGVASLLDSIKLWGV